MSELEKWELVLAKLDRIEQLLTQMLAEDGPSTTVGESVLVTYVKEQEPDGPSILLLDLD